MTKPKNSLLITGCRQVATLAGDSPRRGTAMRELSIINDGALLIEDGRIAAMGTRREIERRGDARRAAKLDVGGRVVVPGLVDSHTHLVFPVSRAAEYEQRIAGATYEEIARSGGGILSTVRHLRGAKVPALERTALAFLEEFAAHGTTTLEAKSGYGLDWPSERRILRLLRQLSREQPVEIVPTFLGAHVIPPEYRAHKHGAEEYIARVCKDMLPAVAREKLAQFCDVFVDRGSFTVDQARRIFAAARAVGLAPRLHAEQLSRTGAARLAIEAGAASADHLEHVDSSDIRALAKSAVTCTMLPGCSFHLGLRQYAPARALIDAGAIVALATDFNPGTSPTLSLPMAMTLACNQMRMTPAEALTACTINAAHSLRLDARIGSLQVGKDADLAVFDVCDYREIPYYFGVNYCWLTIKRGAVVYSRGRRVAARVPHSTARRHFERIEESLLGGMPKAKRDSSSLGMTALRYLLSRGRFTAWSGGGKALGR
jgi:imidazolonepropionase